MIIINVTLSNCIISYLLLLTWFIYKILNLIWFQTVGSCYKWWVGNCTTNRKFYLVSSVLSCSDEQALDFLFFTFWFSGSGPVETFIIRHAIDRLTLTVFNLADRIGTHVLPSTSAATNTTISNITNSKNHLVHQFLLEGSRFVIHWIINERALAFLNMPGYELCTAYKCSLYVFHVFFAPALMYVPKMSRMNNKFDWKQHSIIRKTLNTTWVFKKIEIRHLFALN